MTITTDGFVPEQAELQELLAKQAAEADPRAGDEEDEAQYSSAGEGDEEGEGDGEGEDDEGYDEAEQGDVDKDDGEDGLEDASIAPDDHTSGTPGGNQSPEVELAAEDAGGSLDPNEDPGGRRLTGADDAIEADDVSAPPAPPGGAHVLGGSTAATSAGLAALMPMPIHSPVRVGRTPRPGAGAGRPGSNVARRWALQSAAGRSGGEAAAPARPASRASGVSSSRSSASSSAASSAASSAPPAPSAASAASVPRPEPVPEPARLKGLVRVLRRLGVPVLELAFFPEEMRPQLVVRDPNEAARGALHVLHAVKDALAPPYPISEACESSRGVGSYRTEVPEAVRALMEKGEDHGRDGRGRKLRLRWGALDQSDMDTLVQVRLPKEGRARMKLSWAGLWGMASWGGGVFVDGGEAADGR